MTLGPQRHSADVGMRVPPLEFRQAEGSEDEPIHSESDDVEVH